MQIYPSILEDNLEKFTTQFAKLAPFFDHFQIDIADGEFVPHKTVQISELLEWSNQHFEGKTFEFHLMVNDYKASLDQLTKIGENIHITRIFIHAQALGSNTVSHPQYEIGIVLNPEDTLAQYLELAMRFSCIQLMTVYPGFQGTPFIPEVLDKIDALRVAGYTGDIVLDGGINDQSFAIILAREHKPTAVCPGSYLHEDTAHKLEILQSL